MFFLVFLDILQVRDKTNDWKNYPLNVGDTTFSTTALSVMPLSIKNLKPHIVNNDW